MKPNLFPFLFLFLGILALLARFGRDSYASDSNYPRWRMIH